MQGATTGSLALEKDATSSERNSCELLWLVVVWRVSFVSFESFRMQFSTSSVPFGLSLIFPHKSRQKLPHMMLGLLLCQGIRTTQCRLSSKVVPTTCVGVALLHGPGTLLQADGIVLKDSGFLWQVIGVAQGIKNVVFMGSSSYESLRFTQVYIYIYIYRVVVTRFWNQTPDIYPGYVW